MPPSAAGQAGEAPRPSAPKEEPKKQPEPEPVVEEVKELTEEDIKKNEALKEKDLGSQAYKKRDFAQALTHFNNAFELDNTNITILTNKTGKLIIET
ncbi:hypothetical protein K502DRAFT_326341 [Neoconidiobolus thromboides FSU 785]|nr:hypothetical protein K502DRAFT_326341 [Neoconidiobolus thromboides FSU 785]